MKQQYFSLGAQRISVLETAPIAKSNHTLFFLHGRFSGSDSWIPVLTDLSRSFRCIVFDFPGFGDSFSEDDSAMTFPEHARLVQLLVENYANETRSILIGQDYGASIAQFSLAQNPKPYSAIILINGASLFSEPLGLSEGWIDYFRARGLIKRILRGSKLSKEIKRDLFSPWRNRASYRLIWKAIHAIEKSWPTHDEIAKIWDEFQRIQKPALLLWGKNDILNSFGDNLHLLKDLKHTDFFENEECGHWAHLESPEWVVSKIREFIFRLEDHVLEDRRVPHV